MGDLAPARGENGHGDGCGAQNETQGSETSSLPCRGIPAEFAIEAAEPEVRVTSKAEGRATRPADQIE